MDLYSYYLYNQKNNINSNNYDCPRDNIKSKKSRKSSPRKKNSYINNNNILQFSLNTINNILINNLNSSVSLGFLNLTNDNNIPRTLNNDVYINSLNDTIDYKIRGNIYKQDKNIFLNNFPNLIPLLTNKSCKKINRHEIKIMKLNKDIINSKNKTPIKKLDRHYYFNLMQNHNINRDKYKHFKNNSENIDNNIDIESEENQDIKKSKIINNYDKYSICRTYTTINSKEKDKTKQINNYQNNNIAINQNKNAYKKKSPTKVYIINKTSLNSKEKNTKESKTKISESKNPISFKNKFVYKVVKTSNNSPNKLIILNKTKENILKKKNKEILTNKKSNLIIPKQPPKQIKHEHSQSYNIHSYKPIPNSERNTYYNINTNNTNKIINNKIVIVNRNNNKLNKVKHLTLTNINKNIKEKNQNNKNLNAQYIPPNNKFNKIEINSYKQNNKNRYVLSKTINDSNNSQKIKNAFYTNKNVNNINNIQKNNNNAFIDDESSIFKVIDYTQIMTPDEFSNSKNSLTNSNKLNQLSGSNGTNTNQDTDYNSLKKFNYNNNILTNDFGDNNYYNSGNDINFSFNNL